MARTPIEGCPVALHPWGVDSVAGVGTDGAGRSELGEPVDFGLSWNVFDRRDVEVETVSAMFGHQRRSAPLDDGSSAIR